MANFNKSNTIFTVEGIDNNVLHLSNTEECYVEDFKPYLRSIHKLTKEEADKNLNAIIEKMNEITSKDIKFDI